MDLVEDFEVERGVQTFRDALTFAVPLVVALVVGVPLVAVGAERAGVGMLPGTLGALAFVGVAYLAYVLRRGKLLGGAFVAFFVLSTFAANLPIGATDRFLSLAPGSLGPQVWLMQGPLLVIVGYLLYCRAFTLDSVSPVELLFAGFVVWTALAALFGAGPRSDIALFFTWLMLQTLVVITVVRRGVLRGVISLNTVFASYIAALAGHIAFGTVQIVNQYPVGLTFLGESIGWNRVSYPPGVTNLVMASGLSGHAYVLVGLVLLTFPPLLWFAYRSDRGYGTAGMALAVVTAVFLRLTTSDAGRGAFIVLAGTLAVGTTLLLWRTNRDSVLSLDRIRELVEVRASNLLRSVSALALGVLAVLYPSNKSGATSRDVDLDIERPVTKTRTTSERPTENPATTETNTPAANATPTTPTETITTPTETVATPTETVTTPTETVTTPTETVTTPTETVTTPTETVTETPTVADNVPGGGGVADVSVFLFNLSNLGTRLQQYIVGVDLFLRFPLFGVGGGNFRFLAAEYGLPNAPNKTVPLALHNVYIMLLAETGLPGFVLYVTAVAAVLFTGLKLCLDGNRRYFHLAVLVGLVSYLAFMFFTHMIDKITILFPFWVVAAALVGESEVE
jgi:hypothetical protein